MIYYRHIRNNKNPGYRAGCCSMTEVLRTYPPTDVVYIDAPPCCAPLFIHPFPRFRHKEQFVIQLWSVYFTFYRSRWKTAYYYSRRLISRLRALAFVHIFFRALIADLPTKKSSSMKNLTVLNSLLIKNVPRALSWCNSDLIISQLYFIVLFLHAVPDFSSFIYFPRQMLISSRTWIFVSTEKDFFTSKANWLSWNYRSHWLFPAR